MKKCPECGLELPDEVLYCLYCGNRTSNSKYVKLYRKLFFLFPFFIIVVCLASTYDLGITNFQESGLLIASISICIYFFGAFLLGIIRLFSKIRLDAKDFFTSALTSLINAITTVFVVYSVSELFLEKNLEKLGPTVLVRNQILFIFVVYLVIQVAETISIAVKSKFDEKSLQSKTTNRYKIFGFLPVGIPGFFIIFTSILFFMTKEPSRIAFFSNVLIEISAKDKASNYIDEGLKAYPDNAQLCYLKSKILINLDKLPSSQDHESESEALKYATKATKEKPDSILYKYNLSIHYEINKDYEKAIAIAKEAAILAKDDAFLWQFVGDINLKYSFFQETISAYKKSLEIDPNNATVLNNLSYTLLTNNKELVIALELAKKSVELAPNSIANRDTLAWAYYKNNQFTNALETINLLYENRKEISPELDFHYAAILDSMDLLSQPLEIYDKMLVKPEVATNKDLILQIIEARQKAEEKSKAKKGKQ